jgi:hypothetical protein
LLSLDAQAVREHVTALLAINRVVIRQNQALTAQIASLRKEEAEEVNFIVCTSALMKTPVPWLSRRRSAVSSHPMQMRAEW